ncbi:MULTISPECIES: alginate O-acetyltransferase AlgF [Pseudomonas]|nr:MULTISPECIES: alginate O-acetyltransferase AlgF [Pseudomonas]KAB0489611.1 cell division protein FtsQ [Pseudomonas psychrophila]KMM95696.1 cell division protein FtsQ [Pseudomonas psychrophila]KOX65702.1 cell division protein FtsQ [Pseudomonas psychrophila]MDY7584773.1 cell division protein FtsQ [Pseudomonas sp. CCI3.1]MEB0069431.1 cell division protein FtsQ [Pseudomonas sp. CCI3.1]
MTLLCSMCTLAADFALYPTGPDQDAAFIRFVNATTAPLDVLGQAGQPPLRLEVAQPASLLFAVDSTSPVKGSLVSGAHTLALDLKVEPGEFTTIVVVSQEAGIEQVAVRETPDDFNGLKASLAFVNVDKSCSDASLRPAGRSADLFKAVPVASLQRRSINPVNLSVQLVCANANVGAPLDLGMLKAGERYSVLLVPSATGPRLLSATDTLSH